MKQWEVPEEEGWTVKLDVEDMGGHLGTTCRAGGSSLACRVRKMIAAVFALGAASLASKVKFVVVRCKFLPAGVHGIDGAGVCEASLRSLGAAMIVVYLCLSSSSDSHLLLRSCLGTGMRFGTQNMFCHYPASSVHLASLFVS